MSSRGTDHPLVLVRSIEVDEPERFGAGTAVAAYFGSNRSLTPARKTPDQNGPELLDSPSSSPSPLLPLPLSSSSPGEDAEIARDPDRSSSSLWLSCTRMPVKILHTTCTQDRSPRVYSRNDPRDCPIVGKRSRVARTEGLDRARNLSYDGYTLKDEHVLCVEHARIAERKGKR